MLCTDRPVAVGALLASAVLVVAGLVQGFMTATSAACIAYLGFFSAYGFWLRPALVRWLNSEEDKSCETR